VLNFKNKLSPYEGLTLKGVVEKTFIRGNLVFDVHEGGFTDTKPLGVLL
jgi:allantoinase